MLRKILVVLFVFSLSLPLVTCKKAQRIKPTGQLTFEQADLVDIIPLEYGKLMAITPDGDLQAVLWFEKADKTIVVVRVNYSRGSINRNVLLIPRR